MFKKSLSINVVGFVFGKPKKGPNRGITDVKHPMGIRIFGLTSDHPAHCDVLLTIVAESTDSAKKPPHNPANEPGSSSGRTNTIRMNIANIAPVPVPEEIMCFQFM